MDNNIFFQFDRYKDAYQSYAVKAAEYFKACKHLATIQAAKYTPLEIPRYNSSLMNIKMYLDSGIYERITFHLVPDHLKVYRFVVSYQGLKLVRANKAYTGIPAGAQYSPIDATKYRSAAQSIADIYKSKGAGLSCHFYRANIRSIYGAGAWNVYYAIYLNKLTPVSDALNAQYQLLEREIETNTILYIDKDKIAAYFSVLAAFIKDAHRAAELLTEREKLDFHLVLPHESVLFLEYFLQKKASENNFIIQVSAAPVEHTALIPFPPIPDNPHPAQITGGKVQAVGEGVAKPSKPHEYTDSTLKEMFFDPHQYEKLISLLKSPEYGFVSESPNGLNWKASRVKAAILIKALAGENPAILIAPSLFNVQVQAIANNTFAFVGGTLKAETVKGAQPFHNKEIFSPLLKKLTRKS